MKKAHAQTLKFEDFKAQIKWLEQFLNHEDSQVRLAYVCMERVSKIPNPVSWNPLEWTKRDSVTAQVLKVGVNQYIVTAFKLVETKAPLGNSHIIDKQSPHEIYTSLPGNLKDILSQVSYQLLELNPEDSNMYLVPYYNSTSD